MQQPKHSQQKMENKITIDDILHPVQSTNESPKFRRKALDQLDGCLAMTPQLMTSNKGSHNNPSTPGRIPLVGSPPNHLCAGQRYSGFACKGSNPDEDISLSLISLASSNLDALEEEGEDCVSTHSGNSNCHSRQSSNNSSARNSLGSSPLPGHDHLVSISEAGPSSRCSSSSSGSASATIISAHYPTIHDQQMYQRNLDRYYNSIGGNNSKKDNNNANDKYASNNHDNKNNKNNNNNTTQDDDDDNNIPYRRRTYSSPPKPSAAIYQANKLAVPPLTSISPSWSTTSFCSADGIAPATPSPLSPSRQSSALGRMTASSPLVACPTREHHYVTHSPLYNSDTSETDDEQQAKSPHWYLSKSTENLVNVSPVDIGLNEGADRLPTKDSNQPKSGNLAKLRTSRQRSHTLSNPGGASLPSFV